MPFAEGKEEHGHVPLRLYVRSTCWSESAHERQEAPNQKQKKYTPQYATRHATQHAATPHSNRVFFHSLSDFASNCKNGLCTNQRVLEDRRAADTSRVKLWSSNDRRKSHVFNRFPFFSWFGWYQKNHPPLRQVIKNEHGTLGLPRSVAHLVWSKHVWTCTAAVAFILAKLFTLNTYTLSTRYSPYISTFHFIFFLMTGYNSRRRVSNAYLRAMLQPLQHRTTFCRNRRNILFNGARERKMERNGKRSSFSVNVLIFLLAFGLFQG